MQPVETPQGTPNAAARWRAESIPDEGPAVNDDERKGNPPPPVISAPPERELERKLKADPKDPDAKADVGSDESMDASDPSSATTPGCDDGPAPSSGFPE